MRIHYILAAIYSVLIVVHLFDQPIQWMGIGISAAIIIVMIWMARWLTLSERRHAETIEWFLSNSNEITDKPQHFRDSPFPLRSVSRESDLRSFRVVTSAIIVTIVDDVSADLRSSFLRGCVASAWTLVFGWWGLPWGPVRTIHALAVNITGGDKVTVAKFLEDRELSVDQRNNNLSEQVAASDR